MTMQRIWANYMKTGGARSIAVESGSGDSEGNGGYGKRNTVARVFRQHVISCGGKELMMEMFPFLAAGVWNSIGVVIYYCLFQCRGQGGERVNAGRRKNY